MSGRMLAALPVAMLVWACAVEAASVTATVRTPGGVPVEDAAVVVNPTSGMPREALRRATIEQRDREFQPYLTIVTKGTAIDFPNRDPFKHHVYSFSPPNVFEIKLYADKPAKPILFDKSGEVVLGCNIHDWMEAHVLVVDTPWFAKTGADGGATIKQLPAGTYRLRLWHPRQKTVVADVNVALRGTEARHFDMTIDVAPRAIVKKPPPDASGY
ncbi:MAG: methylamine utilization protein [Sterolibacterium sp.]